MPTGMLFRFRSSNSMVGRSRVAGKHVWRTMMKALNVLDELCERFPDVAGAAPLPFLLRA